MKDEECDKLSKVRDQMGEEIEELTASLFEVTYLFVWFNLLLLIIFLFLQTFCRTIIIQGVRVMVFDAHFQQYFSYIVAVSFYWWRKPEYLEKTTILYIHIANSMSWRINKLCIKFKIRTIQFVIHNSTTRPFIFEGRYFCHISG